ncbi:ATPase/histidine kinase/DNA gyrase B/HSP90 domain-containing protein [Besnoitia besnoiti]|uniref:Protein-serine/threonine kinase n=1 Tax=Besnoitia besnoiti TaxID=94643 RepID=A0A2A9MJQ8_BESBE|nr:ATPase/histidine kinase/DNA gyrase B/HSP90 domain-containing protein [Besnoitia besnoiti]PFH38778.1 ATPase/histidine kinase/DNA gyrase B/HSP90 domain-containing protein [Besnoitia besnoiti]
MVTFAAAAAAPVRVVPAQAPSGRRNSGDFEVASTSSWPRCRPSPATPAAAAGECLLFSVSRRTRKNLALRPGEGSDALPSKPLRARDARGSCPNLLRCEGRGRAPGARTAASPYLRRRKVGSFGEAGAGGLDDCALRRKGGDLRYWSCTSLKSLCRESGEEDLAGLERAGDDPPGVEGREEEGLCNTPGGDHDMQGVGFTMFPGDGEHAPLRISPERAAPLCGGSRALGEPLVMATTAPAAPLPPASPTPATQETRAAAESEGLALPVKPAAVVADGEGADGSAGEAPATETTAALSPFADASSTALSDASDCGLSPRAEGAGPASPSPACASEAGEEPSGRAISLLPASGLLCSRSRGLVTLACLEARDSRQSAHRQVVEALFPSPPAPYLSQLLQLRDVYEAAFLALRVLPERYLQRIHQLDALQALVGPGLYAHCPRLAAVRAIYERSYVCVSDGREGLMAELLDEATRHRQQQEDDGCDDDDDWPSEDAYHVVYSKPVPSAASAGKRVTFCQPSDGPEHGKAQDAPRHPRATLLLLSEQLQNVKVLQGQVGPDLLAGMAQLVELLDGQTETDGGEKEEGRQKQVERIRRFVDHFLHAFFSCRVAAELQREHFLRAVELDDCGAILSSHVAMEHLICRAALDAQELSLHHLGVAPAVEIYTSEPHRVDEELQTFLLAASRSEGPSSMGWSSLSSPASSGACSPMPASYGQVEDGGLSRSPSPPCRSQFGSPRGQSPRSAGLPSSVRFPCFPAYAYSGIFELLKNAMRASVDVWTAERPQQGEEASAAEGTRALRGAPLQPRQPLSVELAGRAQEEGSLTCRSSSSVYSNASVAACAVRGPWNLVTLGKSRRLKQIPGRQLVDREVSNLPPDAEDGGKFLRKTRVVQLEDNAPPAVKVNILKVNDSLVIQVEDCGKGLTSDELRRVWSFAYSTAHKKAPALHASEKGVAPGREADRGEAPLLAGCGVGLPMSRVHAQSLGGEIFIESAEGIGTCAYMCLSNLQEFRDHALRTERRSHYDLLQGVQLPPPLAPVELAAILSPSAAPSAVTSSLPLSGKSASVSSLASAFSQMARDDPETDSERLTSTCPSTRSASSPRAVPSLHPFCASPSSPLACGASTPSEADAKL